MKPNTRLLVRMILEDQIRTWGYDYPYYKTQKALRADIEKDFKEMPVNTEIGLFYHNSEDVVFAKSGKELANKSIAWLKSTGDYK